MPDDELPDAAGLVDDRLAVAHLADDVEGAPQLLPGPLVERHHQRVRLAADDGDQPVAVDQRRARDTPGGDAGVVVVDIVLRPDQLARFDIDTTQNPGRADRIHAVAVDRWRGARAAGVRDLQHAVRRGPLVGPQLLPGRLVEGDEALGAVERARLRILQPVENEHAPARHGRSRETGSDRRPPRNLQGGIRKLVDDPGLVPDRQAVGAAPLRPVLGAHRLRPPDDACNDKNGNSGPATGATERSNHPATPFTRNPAILFRSMSAAPLLPGAGPEYPPGPRAGRAQSCGIMAGTQRRAARGPQAAPGRC